MKRIILTILIIFLIITPALADGLSDMDKDGILDQDEIEIYKTNPENSDTDGDGFNDWIELNNGYSPLDSNPIKLEDADYDNDGLSDRMELNFHTDLSKADTDSDGHTDGEEIQNGYDPLNNSNGKLEKRIEINTGSQELSYFLGGVRMETFIVSTGKPSMQTPKGHFNIDDKNLKAWSANYGLWMPYWMSLSNGYFGIHELPEWPNGYKEGADHLGQPVSHGCIRLGIGDAEFLYNWAEIQTAVFIY
ncbi:L,D-transpeptidase family protein [Patescibacteria group bacterium]